MTTGQFSRYVVRLLISRHPADRPSVGQPAVGRMPEPGGLAGRRGLLSPTGRGR